MNNVRISLTHGPGGENHRGMEIVGKKPVPGTGYTMEDLDVLNSKWNNSGFTTQLHDFGEGAGVLVVRNYATNAECLEMWKEWNSFEWDKKLFDPNKDKRDDNGCKIIGDDGKPLKGRVMNKRARYNVVGAEGLKQEPEYSKGKGRIIDTNELPVYKHVKSRLMTELREGLEGKSEKVVDDYITEGNLYYDPKKTYIGWHGDTERAEVVCLSLGGKNYPLRFCWFQHSKAIGEPTELLLNSGDLYIMSEKAVGADWKSRSLRTMRHSAGWHKNASVLPGKRKRKPKQVNKATLNVRVAKRRLI